MIPQVEEDSDFLKIRINGLLHVHFLRKFYRGMQAYNNGIYTIEILLKDQTLRLEYDLRETWEKVLKVLDDNL